VKNIIFIGMPGCGKTTVSRKLAEDLGLPWFDCDVEIEKFCGMSIPQIFETRGEDYFRAKETEVLARLLESETGDGIVLATGGGAVLRNTELLRGDKENKNFVIYLHRSVHDILATLAANSASGAVATERPLLHSATAEETEKKLNATYAARKELYERACHAKVENAGSVEETLAKVKEALPHGN